MNAGQNLLKRRLKNEGEGEKRKRLRKMNSVNGLALFEVR
jgi:hypothetical protein